MLISMKTYSSFSYLFILIYIFELVCNKLSEILTSSFLHACHNLFVKKPKIFENAKSESAAANFQKSRTLHTLALISKNSQILGIKNMFAGSIITMSMIQHHFCLIIMNEKLINF